MNKQEAIKKIKLQSQLMSEVNAAMIDVISAIEIIKDLGENTELLEKADDINPEHYKFGNMQSMDFVEAVLEYGGFTAKEGAYLQNIIKYTTRSPRKNGIRDLKKAQWYIERWIESEENKSCYK